MLDQRKLMLWMKRRCSDNILLHTISTLKHNEPVVVCSKYRVDVCNISEYLIKDSIWTAFCDTVKF